MKYKQLVKEVAKDLNIKPQVINYIIDRFIGVIVEGLIKDREVMIKNLCNIKITIVNDNELHAKLTLSTNIRKALRRQLIDYPENYGIVHRDSWKDAARWVKPKQEESAFHLPNDTVLENYE